MPTTGTILRQRYKIIYILGSGGFGDTYLAEDIDLPNHPKCVVKHLKPNSDPAVLEIVRRLFDSEAKVLYRLGNDSDQIPRLFAHFEEQGEFYLVQEFVDGEDLSKEISPGKRLSEKEVTKLLQEILEVLAVVHKKNIIHRDIKPANLMRRRQDRKIVLIDFGAVKEINTIMVNTQGQTSVSVIVGTNGYMPSEQAAGQPKLCSDVYAVGMLGISALTGREPHELPKDPTDGEVIWRNLANVSDKLALVLDKMVIYHFRDRYFSALEALQALQQLQPPPQIAPTQLKPPSPPPPQPQPTPPQRRPSPPPPVPQPQPQPTPNLSRRQVIKTAGWLAGGFGLAVVGNRLLFSSGSNSIQSFTFETVTVNAQGKITNRRNLQAEYFEDNLGNGVSLEMVQIPGGTFTMGSPAGEAQRQSDEGPQRQVRVPGFFMGKYPVTQAQYQAIMGTNPAFFKGEKRPVETVNWDEAVEFCKQLGQRTGKTYRLPSEAEWEYACRAGTTTPFYFGETITTDLVNYDGNNPYGDAPKGEYRQQTTDVGNFPPNSFGLYDMHGNIWEWCQDVYKDSHQGAPTDGSAYESGNNNDYQLLRGGSWGFNAGSCRSARRFRNARAGRPYYIGFRLVCVA
ncbi:bifunctional serine/threonine-protein kinase/formylglycine-generating enzyme family protein [Nodularia spumigena CS-591/12]|uniref:bifunctional serine/threonine-protein kinase/formylglycine-generating enzyme family protein n=1 Tax=Nodularia spumigena TaxID=70799 RepID=UPI00232CC883|nr:bifunctional serine/threonine-protein kinase/formylglycine-generating enzyme family protein [Nodularia spumigena]MDB9303856.1 bifunctional serine/threonine-protein kinase/formylglycine-generating enzyme family protein [Nodularia spumigena CS-591/12]MDB9347114.1 bifunctional serine/threonine-protein kinase/formylglycine-generating enzyme family protein [Nodularia spumigena CS-588/01]MDB9351426.1 bifunctional serine/threonine-protein kinase/formylglycine-generating enzyme family protein [Nodula